MKFKLKSTYQPTGDQPAAIDSLVKGIEQHKQHQVLLGVTGSGKTFTAANVIARLQRPTLVIAHNKTLAAQLYQEFRDFFPDNAVSYFVSYYDYYQPEAYIPSTDTYIEKDTSINDEIDKLRLATTTNLITRQDVIVVASVSCIYNLGSPIEYGRQMMEIVEGMLISRQSLLLRLSDLQYERATAELRRGSFRVRGDTIQIWPAYEDVALRIELLENKIERFDWIDPVTGSPLAHDDRPQLIPGQPGQAHPPRSQRATIYPARHYVVDPKSQQQAMAEIEQDLARRVAELNADSKVLEAYRLQQKVSYDLEMIKEFGFVNGIENYSRYFDGRQPGQPPYSLLEYFQENNRLFETGGFLTIIDESHMTIPQIRGMFHGDRSRKQTLVDYGFRLPSALDNRPLQFHEFLERTGQMLYVSATPDQWEVSQAGGEVVEQLVRPTGLVDPVVELRRTRGQIEDLVIEILQRKQAGQRVLVTTLTKKMAEALTEYLNQPAKIRKLVSRFRAGQRAEQQAEQRGEFDPDRPVEAGQGADQGTNQSTDRELPIDDLRAGPIKPRYYSAARLEVRQAHRGAKQTQPRPPLAAQPDLPKVAYLHSDIATLERSDILDDLRSGVYDVLVGINLLREGLDLPEVTLVAILDADKEGFLRSRTSLIQTMGRAARHSQGKAIMYAETLTQSMLGAIAETQRRRHVQLEYNQSHGITPLSIAKPIRQRMIEKQDEDETGDAASHSGQAGKRQRGPGRGTAGHSPGGRRAVTKLQLTRQKSVVLEDIDPEALTPQARKQLIAQLRRQMNKAAGSLDYELAAAIRDTINQLAT